MKRSHTRAPPLVRACASPTPGGIAGAPDRYRSALASNVEASAVVFVSEDRDTIFNHVWNANDA